MDEEPFVIAAMMAEEEKRRQEKIVNDRKDNTYQPFRYEQPSGGSIIGWILIGIIVIIVFLLIGN